MTRIFPSDAALTSTNGFAPAAIAGARSRTGRSPDLPPDGAASPNQVIIWNRILLSILRAPGKRPATIHPTRSSAMMHLAIADAVGAITRRFAPYGSELTASRYASQAAAAAAAAHEVLAALYPAMKPTLDVELASSLSTVRDGSGKTDGVAIGVRAGQSILRLRQYDGVAGSAPPFLPGTAPGEYQLTPPDFTQPAFTHWPAVTPFALQRANQFVPGSPPPVTSEAYASALAEVRLLGERGSLTRSPAQMLIGRFWSAPIQSFWNEIAQTASLAHHDSVADDARLFALLNMSFADGTVALYDAKYAYRYWRPVSAITIDGRPADPAWEPLVRTPANPSYPSGHSVISFGAARILEEEFGDRFDFDVTSEVLPEVPRHFPSFRAAAIEAGLSRIYAGDQFRFDHEAGERLGRRIARFVVAHELARERLAGARRR